MPLIVCVFKPAVHTLLGRVALPGFQPETFAGSEVFRIPGPYAPSADADRVMQELEEYLSRR